MITENLYDRFKNFHRVNPGMSCAIMAKPDSLDAAANEERLRDWMTYISVMGRTKDMGVWLKILKEGKGITVPCEKPEHFDPAYVPPAHRWSRPVEPEQSPEQREKIIAGFRRLMGKFDNPIPVYEDEFKKQQRRDAA